MQLIEVKEENGKQLVSARDLYNFLEASERFSNWFDRMKKYGFEENQDFTGCKVFNTLAKKELQDYALTLDCAKEISMLQRSEKGKQARKYFIECEKKLKNQLPQTFADALRLAADQAELIESQKSEIQNLEEALDESEQWISIVRAATQSGVSESKFNWRILKAYSIENGIEIKTAPCPRFKTKKLYHVSVFNNCYPHIFKNY